MKGIEGATQALVDRLGPAGEVINLKIAELRERYDDPDLPDVNLVTGFDGNRIAMEEWPAIMVVPQTEPKMLFQNTDGVDERWNVRYRHQVFVWVRGDDEPSTAVNRYRITLALRETLMTSRLFDIYELDPTSFITSYSDVMVEKDSQATIAGAYIQLEMTADEILHVAEPLGTADTTDVNTGLLPPHPALS